MVTLLIPKLRSLNKNGLSIQAIMKILSRDYDVKNLLVEPGKSLLSSFLDKNMFDEIIFMKAPSFNYVLNWRLKQENKNTSKSKKSKKMNANEIKLFIQHYEKITKWMLINFKNIANFIIKIDLI